MQRWAAGVLPVAVHPHAGTPMLLLGLDARSKGGKWSDFAGGGEACDASPHHTALRELAEETGGTLTLSTADLADALEFRGTTPTGKSLFRYVVRVDFDDTIQTRFRGSKDDEKIALDWFPLHALPPLRRSFALQMRADAPAIRDYALRRVADHSVYDAAAATSVQPST